MNMRCKKCEKFTRSIIPPDHNNHKRGIIIIRGRLNKLLLEGSGVIWLTWLLSRIIWDKRRVKHKQMTKRALRHKTTFCQLFYLMIPRDRDGINHFSTPSTKDVSTYKLLIPRHVCTSSILIKQIPRALLSRLFPAELTFVVKFPAQL